MEKMVNKKVYIGSVGVSRNSDGKILLSAIDDSDAVRIVMTDGETIKLAERLFAEVRTVREHHG